MTEEKPKPRRIPFMSARQVAITAVIGGIAFLCEAIGLWAPTPWPGGTINIGGFAITIAAMLAGPWAGCIVGWLDLAPMAGFGPIAGWLYFVTPLYTAAGYKLIYGIVKRNKPLGLVVFFSYQSVMWIVGNATIFCVWFWFVIESFPNFSSCWYYVTITGFPIFGWIYAVLPTIVLAIATDFFEPRWSWWPGRSKN